MWIKLAPALAFVFFVCAPAASPQEPAPPKTGEQKSEPNQKPEPQYEDTFSGSVVECSSTKVVVSRSILGQPAENRPFMIKQDTKVEGKLSVNVKVTVGFVMSEDGDVAKLIVVRGQQPKK